MLILTPRGFFRIGPVREAWANLEMLEVNNASNYLKSEGVRVICGLYIVPLRNPGPSSETFGRRPPPPVSGPDVCWSFIRRMDEILHLRNPKMMISL